MVNKEKLWRMAKLTGIFMFGYLLTGCEGSSSVNVNNILTQKCNNGDTRTISGVSVAEADFLLQKGSSVGVDLSTVTGDGDGIFKVSKGVKILPDGRTVIEVIYSAAPNHLITIIGQNENGSTRISFAMECDDTLKIPPLTPKTNQ